MKFSMRNDFRILLLLSLFFLIQVTANSALAGVGYVVSNKADENTVIGFRYDENSGFSEIGEFPTGGKGTGDLEVPGLSPRDDSHPLADGQDPLISAYAIEKTEDGKFILVANPGDGSISSMKVNEDMSLTKVSTVKSGGAFPISIATHGNTVVVANIGKSNFKGVLSGFTLDGDGNLQAVKKSRAKLGSLGGRPAAVRFTPDGKHVIVTQILSGVIAVFPVTDGVISRRPVSTYDSPQSDDRRWLANPVGFELIDRGDEGSIAIVSEARFFKPGLQLEKKEGNFFFETSSTSSYKIGLDGSISLISGDIFTGTQREGGQRTSCWVGISGNGKYAYSVNALDSSISSYQVDQSGAITLMEEVAYKTPKYTFLTDIYPSDDGQYLYQLHGFGGGVSVLKVESDGALTEKAVWAGDNVPEVGAFGMLAY